MQLSAGLNLSHAALEFHELRLQTARHQRILFLNKFGETIVAKRLWTPDWSIFGHLTAGQVFASFQHGYWACGSPGDGLSPCRQVTFTVAYLRSSLRRDTYDVLFNEHDTLPIGYYFRPEERGSLHEVILDKDAPEVPMTWREPRSHMDTLNCTLACSMCADNDEAMERLHFDDPGHPVHYDHEIPGSSWSLRQPIFDQEPQLTEQLQIDFDDAVEGSCCDSSEDEPSAEERRMQVIHRYVECRGYPLHRVFCR